MRVDELFPLIKVPPGWPVPVIATFAMVVLAALDLAGAVAAKEWARFGVELPTGKWVAITVVLLAQAYLLLAPSAPATGRTAG